MFALTRNIGSGISTDMDNYAQSFIENWECRGVEVKTESLKHATIVFF